MEGRYRIEDGLLTFDGVAALAEGYAFPMVCAVAFEPNGFRLDVPEGVEGGCVSLAGTTFTKE